MFRSRTAGAVLMIDDEGLTRMVTADLLMEEGYRVIPGINADAAVSVLRSRSDVRLVITDVDMPGTMNGFALARFVDETWPEIGIIVTSGHVRPGPGDLPPKARFLRKPYSPTSLLQVVREVLPPRGVTTQRIG